MTAPRITSGHAPAPQPSVSKCAPTKKLISRVRVSPATMQRLDALARGRRVQLADLAGEILDEYVRGGG